MVLTMDLSKENLSNLFLKELGIEHPTEDQKKVIEVYDDGVLTKPIILRMLKEGKSTGEIAHKLRMNRNSVKSKIKRLKKMGAE